MAFTKINAAGIGTTERVTVDGLTIINNLSVGGTVSIAGTLTYEDVTNVDAVGLITARSGINVSGGTATFASDVSIADKIIHTGDTDTAIRFPDADTITAETGGIERLRINSTGIGVTGRLSVHHSIVDTEGEFLRIGRTDLPTIRYHSIKAKHGGAIANNYISFLLHDISDTTSQSEVLRLRSDGFVGIGSTVPAYTLDLGESSSTIRLVSENDGTAIRVGTGGNSSDVTLIRVDGASVNHDGESDDSANGFSFKYLGSGSGVNNRFSICPDNQAGTQLERVTVLQDGKVGIGTSSPATNLHVTTSSASAIPLTIERTFDNNAVVHYKNPTLSMYAGLAGEGLGWGVGTGADLGDGATNKLMITSDGNIGISTLSPTGKFSVGKVGGYLNRDGITVTNPHSSGLKNGVFVLNESGYNATVSYRAAAFKAVGTAGFAIGISTDQGSNGLGGTLNYSVNFDGKSVQDGSITANGSFYHEEAGQTNGGDTQDKTVTFNARGVFLMLISYSLGTTTTDVNRNVYSLGLFTSRSNGATWTAIQQDLTSTHVGNLTISDGGSAGQLRIQKSSGSDNRACAFRIDVLSSANVKITVTDT